MAESKERPSAPRIGDVLDEKFRLSRELGRGAMGAVYLADDVSLPGERVQAVPRQDENRHRGGAHVPGQVRGRLVGDRIIGQTSENEVLGMIVQGEIAA